MSSDFNSPQRRRSTPSKKKRKGRPAKKRRINAVIKSPLFIIAAVLVIVFGVATFFDPATTTLQEASDAVTEIVNTHVKGWPPPKGGEVYGSTYGGKVVELTEETITSPLRPRSVDPWIRISNQRLNHINTDQKKMIEFTFDVEELRPISKHNVLFIARQNSQYGQGYPHFFSRQFPKGIKGKETITIGYSVASVPNLDFSRPIFNNYELYAVILARDYKVSRDYNNGAGSGNFKFMASNTVEFGSMNMLTYPREWHEKEREYLLSKPVGELFLRFEGADVVSTEPFDVEAAQKSHQADTIEAQRRVTRAHELMEQRRQKLNSQQ